MVTLWDTTDIKVSPNGNEFGVYLSERFRISPLLIAEGGLRYDHISYTSDGDISPRLNLLYRLGTKSTLRLGWGRFFQSQGINELDVEYGSQIFYPAQLAERRVVGFEHLFQNGIDLRIEAYHIKLSRSRPRYDILSSVALIFFPELGETSILLIPKGGVSKGIEFYLKRDIGNKFSWWGSYGLSWAEEKIDGVNVPKDFDQRHTIYIDTNYITFFKIVFFMP
ncbi:MAG: TonB-dependent receptor [Bacteroidetes bacterium]|nr:TonB-dependent receptor [Bacteroidota bacterium]